MPREPFSVITDEDSPTREKHAVSRCGMALELPQIDTDFNWSAIRPGFGWTGEARYQRHKDSATWTSWRVGVVTVHALCRLAELV
jgi:hypothetical protein